MSDYQIFSSCTPLAMAGETLEFTVWQSLVEGGSRLKLQGPNAVFLKVEGPRLSLETDDVVGIYPAAGSEESPDEFLPHIALKRRTLPWERLGPRIPNTLGLRYPTWLALMLLKESEFRAEGDPSQATGAKVSAVKLSEVESKDSVGYKQLKGVLGLQDSTPLNVLYLPSSRLAALRPKLADLKYATHMRRNLVTGEDTAIVFSPRLPDAGTEDSPAELHTALLVSLEQRDDLYDDDARSSGLPGFPPPEYAAFVVLHHWTFKPSKGGDFEQVIRSIGIRPNGGVLRFGNLPKAAPPDGEPVPLSGGFAAALDKDGFAREPMPHTQAGTVVWRGPLRPFEAPPRSGGFAVRAAPEEFQDAGQGEPKDHSHAAAFELGRLLALGNSGVLQDLREVHGVMEPLIKPQVAINKLPIGLQKKDWVQEEVWRQSVREPWAMEVNGQLQSIVKGAEFLDAGVGDVTGIGEEMADWIGDVLTDLESMPAPVSAPVVTQIDLNTVGAGLLDQTFADVKTIGLS